MTDGSQAGAQQARRTWGHQGSGSAHSGPKAPIFFPEPTGIDPPPLGLRLEALKPSSCRWVIGDTHTYCGQRAKDGSSYCTGHHSHVYAPATRPINVPAIMARLDMYGAIADAVPTVGGSGTPTGFRIKSNIPPGD